MNITPAGAQLIFQHVELQFQEGYGEAEITYPQWTTRIPSYTREEHYVWMDKIPMVREWVGPRAIKNVVAQEYTLKNKKWEVSEALKREDMEDEQASVFSLTPKFMGQQAKIHPDILAAAVLEAGNSIATYDTANFFSTSHPVDVYNAGQAALGGATTQSNLFSTAAGNGSFPFNAANVAFGKATMRKWCGRDGHRLGIKPTHAMVPPALEQQGIQLTQMQYIAPSAGFGINGTAMQENALRGQLQLIVNDRLTSDTAWYLLDLSKPINPFVFQDRMPVEFTYRINNVDENVWAWDVFQYGTRARYNVGYSLWFLAAKFDI